MNKLEFISIQQVLIYSLIKFNCIKIKDLNFNFPSRVEEQIPKIQLGRQVGHTWAARFYISDNPDKKFGIVNLSMLQYKDLYAGLKNANLINTKNFDNMRGKTLDYIIIENSDLFFKNPTNYSNFISFIKYNYPTLASAETKIIALGS